MTNGTWLITSGELTSTGTSQVATLCRALSVHTSQGHWAPEQCRARDAVGASSAGPCGGAHVAAWAGTVPQHKRPPQQHPQQKRELLAHGGPVRRTPAQQKAEPRWAAAPELRPRQGERRAATHHPAASQTRGGAGETRQEGHVLPDLTFVEFETGTWVHMTDVRAGDTPERGRGVSWAPVIFYISTQVVAATCVRTGKTAFRCRLRICKPHSSEPRPRGGHMGSPENWVGSFPSAAFRLPTARCCSGGLGVQTAGRELPHAGQATRPSPALASRGGGDPRPSALLRGQGQRVRPSCPGQGATRPSPLPQRWPMGHTEPSARPRARGRLWGRWLHCHQHTVRGRPL